MGKARGVRFLEGIPRWFWIGLCVLYLLSPWDLLPDVFGPPGFLDDLAVALATLLYLYAGSKTGRAGAARGGARGFGGGRATGRNRRSGEGSQRGGRSQASKDPYVVLGVARGEDLAVVRQRYREKMLQYHPDRVQHLGKEFQELAEQKARELTEAYDRILKERGQKGSGRA